MPDDNWEEFDDFEEDSVEKYIGERNELKQRHGKGWAILPNGDQYDGHYERGQRHGIGLYVFQSGARYLGEYRCGKKCGQGKFFYDDGSIYEGTWKNNLRSGQGLYKYPNGDIYHGDWHKDLKHGLGSYVLKHNDACFCGTWNQGVPVGPVELSFRFYKYHGNWDYQYPQGPGIYSFGCKYMLKGYYKSQPTNLQLNYPCQQEYKKSEENDKTFAIPNLLAYLIPPPIWYAQSMELFDSAKLQVPSKPMFDSDLSSCGINLEMSEEPDVPPGETEPFELEECKIECGEDCFSESITSIDRCSVDYKNI